MLYSVLIYDSEAVVMSRGKEEDDALVARHVKVQEKLKAEGKLGPVARLMPTTAAVTVRQGREVLVLDGPYAETKEQLLGFYVVDCPTLDEAIAAARLIGTACGSLALEVRPIRWYAPGDDSQ
jgi:hypothetical protein